MTALLTTSKRLLALLFVVSLCSIAIGDVYTDGRPYGSVSRVSSTGTVTWYIPASSSAADVGDQFEAAVAAANPDDTITLWPDAVYDIVDTSIVDAGVNLEGNNAKIRPASGTYSNILTTNAERIKVVNLTIEDHIQTNASANGRCLRVTGDKAIVDNVTTIGARATGSVAAYGFYVFGNDCVIRNCKDRDAEYCSIQLHDANRCLVENFISDEPGNRSLNSAGSTTIDWYEVRNFIAFAHTSGTQVQINWNQTGTIEHLVIDGCHLINGDIIATGVSYDNLSRQQMIKFQNVTHCTVKNSSFHHGINQGADAGPPEVKGFGTGLAWDNASESVLISNCSFSDGFIPNGVLHGQFVVEDCYIGAERNEEGIPIYTVHAEDFIFTRNRVNIYDGDRVFTFSASRLPSHKATITDNVFVCNSSSNLEIADANLTLSPGNIIFAGNSLTNSGSGTLQSLASADDRLLVESDRDGRAYYKLGNLGAATTVDWNEGPVQQGDLDGDPTISFTDPSRPQVVTLIMTEDGTASSVTWPGSITWLGASQQPDNGSGVTSVFMFWYDGGSNYYEIQSNN